MKENPYKHKYFSILGDSISTFEGLSEPKNAVYYNRDKKLESGVHTYLGTWFGQVIEHFEGELLVNHSFSGSKVCKDSFYDYPSHACSKERTSSLGKDGIAPDVIMVYMGTNDWGAGVQVNPNPNVKTDEEDLTIFSIAYQKMLERLKTNYPNAEIWCMTLPIAACWSRENYAFPYCIEGRHIEEYCEAICKSAKRFGCRLIDLYHWEEPYDTMDGAHPNASGMRTIANAVIAAAEKNMELDDNKENRC